MSEETRPQAGGRKITIAANDENNDNAGGLKPVAPSASANAGVGVDVDLSQKALHNSSTGSIRDDGGNLSPPVQSSSPRSSLDGNGGSLRGSREGSIRGNRSGSLRESEEAAIRSGSHKNSTSITVSQAQANATSQEFRERADINKQISELDKNTDKDFFLSMSTSKAREARRAPWAGDQGSHPLMLAAASENKSVNSSGSSSRSNINTKTKANKCCGSGNGENPTGGGASASSIDVQIILEELGPLDSVTQVYARDFYGRTPLHIAALNGCPDTVYHLLNSYRKSMYRTGVLDNIARLEREKVVSEAELRAALIASGKYTPQSWDLKVKRMKALALNAGGSTSKGDTTGKGNIIPQLVAVQHWFDQECNRIHRAHEIRVEVYRTKNLCIKDKFGRTPLHYACASGCSAAVLEALLSCSTAALGMSFKEHQHYNVQHVSSALDVAFSSSSSSPASRQRRLFSTGVVYESATGMEIGRTDGMSPQQPDQSLRMKESTRLINKSLRNVAWELTHEQSALGDPKPIKAEYQEGQKLGEEPPLQKVPRSDEAPVTYAEDHEQMYEIIIPWVCRNILSRASEQLTRDGMNNPAVEDEKRSEDTARVRPSTDLFDKLGSLVDNSDLIGRDTLIHEMARLEAGDVDRMSNTLLVPEITTLLARLGIQVTTKVVVELTRRYPAGVSDCNEKWKAVQTVAKCKRDRDRQIAERKSGSKSRSCDGKGDGNSGADEDSKGASGVGESTESKGGSSDIDDRADVKDGAASRETPSLSATTYGQADRTKLEEVLSLFAGGYYDIDVGLDVSFFVRELRNGRAVQSIAKMRKTYADFNDNGTGNAYGAGSGGNGSMAKGISKLCDGDEIKMAELRDLLEDSNGAAVVGSGGAVVTASSLLAQLSCCVSVASIIRVRKQLVNLTDSYGRTPLLIAAANGHKHLVELLLSCGGDTSIPATYQSTSNVSSSGGYRYNALSLAATGSIRSLLEKALLTWLNNANLDGFLSTSSSSSSSGSPDVIDILNSLVSDGKVGRKSLIEAKTTFSVNTQLQAGIGLGLNEAYVHTSEEDLHYEDSANALASKSRLVLGMREHLQMLQSKNWAYSRSPLAWAVNNGLAEVVRCLLQERADPNEVDTTGRTALHEAAALVSTGSDSMAEAALACAELLLRAYADPNKSSVGSRTPMHELFSKGQDDSSSSFGSVTSSDGCYSDSLRTKFCFKMEDGQTSAQRLLRLRRKRRLLRLLLQFGGDAQQLDRMGFAAVHLAARENDAGCVLEMLRYDLASKQGLGGGSGGSSVRSSRDSGNERTTRASTAYTMTARTAQTPLHIACRAGAAPVIQLLCRWEADLSSRKGECLAASGPLIAVTDSQGKTASQYLPPALSASVLDTMWSLAYAGAVSKLGSLLVSIQTSGASVDDEPLSDGDSDNDHENQVSLLGDENESLMVQDPDVSGYVADSIELAHKSKGAKAGAGSDNYDVEQRRRGQSLRLTPLRRATAHEPWLVDGVNAKTRRLRWTPLHACLSGWIKAATAAGNTSAKRVVSGSSSGSSSSNVRNNSSSQPGSPSRRKSINNSTTSNGNGRFQETMALLLQNHCYTDGADWQCRTPLMIAAAANLEAAISMLLASGADVFATDLEGNTPLHMAYAYGSASAAATLESKMGESKNISNHAGKSAFEMAGDMRRMKNLLG